MYITQRKKTATRTTTKVRFIQKFCVKLSSIRCLSSGKTCISPFCMYNIRQGIPHTCRWRQCRDSPLDCCPYKNIELALFFSTSYNQEAVLVLHELSLWTAGSMGWSSDPGYRTHHQSVHLEANYDASVWCYTSWISHSPPWSKDSSRSPRSASHT